jgi:hypothetical protein
MKKIAIEAIYRRPNTSKPVPGHKIYPYFLSKLPIVRPNQVWTTDISCIPMAKGFVCLIAISMDGRGAWRDKFVVERLWRSVKYEEVYLRAYGSVSEVQTSIGRYLNFYNNRRTHSALDRRALDQAYFNQPLLAAA